MLGCASWVHASPGARYGREEGGESDPILGADAPSERVSHFTSQFTVNPLLGGSLSPQRSLRNLSSSEVTRCINRAYICEDSVLPPIMSPRKKQISLALRGPIGSKRSVKPVSGVTAAGQALSNSEPIRSGRPPCTGDIDWCRPSTTPASGWPGRMSIPGRPNGCIGTVGPNRIVTTGPRPRPQSPALERLTVGSVVLPSAHPASFSCARVRFVH